MQNTFSKHLLYIGTELSLGDTDHGDPDTAPHVMEWLVLLKGGEGKDA